MSTGAKRWIHPQAVPRGILRFYIISLLSKKPETGYSIMQTVEDKTEGAWRPGPGTIYPLLKSLVKDGVVEALAPAQKEGKTAYSVTKRGKQELDEMRETMTSTGRKQHMLFRLFADLVSPSVFVSLALTRQRESFDIIPEKMAQLPPPERQRALKEMRAVLESQIARIDSELAGPEKRKSRARVSARPRGNPASS